ncbi:hypothetical protein [Cupriavidus pauculus]|jgi:hypothetical protein|uniref:hypothetical protein n=1 Tax=Cupriavidus pauculus TaxID=82633 RepID=UPI0030FD1436
MKFISRKHTLGLMSAVSCAALLAACGGDGGDGGDSGGTGTSAGGDTPPQTVKTVPTVPVAVQSNYAADQNGNTTDKYNAALQNYNSLGEAIHNQ